MAGRQYRDFQIAGVKAVEEPEERRVTVTWTLAQREEEVLGDEDHPGAQRSAGPQSAAVRAAGRRPQDDGDVRLHQPGRGGAAPALAGVLESRVAPQAGLSEKSGRRDDRERGDYGGRDYGGRETEGESTEGESTEGESTEGESSLTYHRRLDVIRRTLKGPEEYGEIQSLFGEAEKSDAQVLLLVRR